MARACKLWSGYLAAGRCVSRAPQPEKQSEELNESLPVWRLRRRLGLHSMDVGQEIDTASRISPARGHIVS